MIDGLTNAGSIPVLERMAQFAGARHRLITHNVANLSTPEFRPVDVSVDLFRSQLRAAVEQRREERPNGSGPLELEPTDEITFTEDGLQMEPKPIGENILFHDRNDRDLERTMQDLAENFMVYRQAMDLLRNRYQLLNQAIRERL